MRKISRRKKDHVAIKIAHSINVITFGFVICEEIETAGSLVFRLFIRIQIHLFQSNFIYFMNLMKLYTYQAMPVQ